MALDEATFGHGIYTPRQAARLAGVTARDVLRWTRGTGSSSALWTAYYADLENSTDLSFQDLQEVRVVKALRQAGVSGQAIRFAISFAKERFGLARPLSSEHFRTDGAEIFIEALEEDGSLTSLLKKRAGQRVFRQIVEPTLKELIYADSRPILWQPKRAPKVVIDPKRSFGTPILDEWGISTEMLAAELKSAGSAATLSQIYEVPKKDISAALKFESSLDGPGPI